MVKLRVNGGLSTRRACSKCRTPVANVCRLSYLCRCQAREDGWICWPKTSIMALISIAKSDKFVGKRVDGSDAHMFGSVRKTTTSADPSRPDCPPTYFILHNIPKEITQVSHNLPPPQTRFIQLSFYLKTLRHSKYLNSKS